MDYTDSSKLSISASMSTAVTRYTRCQAATRQGAGPQCSNSCHRSRPGNPMIMDRCHSHMSSFHQYQGQDLVSEISPTPYKPPGQGSQASQDVIPPRDAPTTRPPIFRDPGMQTKKSKSRAVPASPAPPDWNRQPGDYEEREIAVAPIPQVSFANREDSAVSDARPGVLRTHFANLYEQTPGPSRPPTARTPSIRQSIEPADPSPGPARGNRPTVEHTPRRGAPKGCDPTVSEFEYMLARQPVDSM